MAAPPNNIRKFDENAFSVTNNNRQKTVCINVTGVVVLYIHDSKDVRSKNFNPHYATLSNTELNQQVTFACIHNTRSLASLMQGSSTPVMNTPTIFVYHANYPYAHYKGEYTTRAVGEFIQTILADILKKRQQHQQQQQQSFNNVGRTNPGPQQQGLRGNGNSYAGNGGNSGNMLNPVADDTPQMYMPDVIPYNVPWNSNDNDHDKGFHYPPGR